MPRQKPLRIEVLQHVDLDANHRGNKAVLTIETDRGTIDLIIPNTLVEKHIDLFERYQTRGDELAAVPEPLSVEQD